MIWATSNARLLKLICAHSGEGQPVFYWWETDDPHYVAHQQQLWSGWAGFGAALNWAIENGYIVDQSGFQWSAQDRF